MDKVLKKAAEILVECGYAQRNTGFRFFIDWEGKDQDIEPFADTLEGRRQADAIEDYLCSEEHSLWHLSEYDVCEKYENSRDAISERQWRLDRIKYCLEQLEEE